MGHSVDDFIQGLNVNPPLMKGKVIDGIDFRLVFLTSLWIWDFIDGFIIIIKYVSISVTLRDINEAFSL